MRQETGDHHPIGDVSVGNVGGNDEAATLYAAYDFLERLGAVFLLSKDVPPEVRPNLTFPYIDVGNNNANVEHEASTARISEDQLFYCKTRGISTEDAISMIVNGFCKDVFKELPMEFAVEAKKLLGISLEGSVG